MSAGHIYILSNPSLASDHFKIGGTSKSVEERVKGLSSATGVPTPFKIAFQHDTLDWRRAENEVKQALSRYRTRDGREFFVVDIRVATNVVLEVVERIRSEMSVSTRDYCAREVFVAVRDWFESGTIAKIGGPELKMRLYWLLGGVESVRTDVEMSDVFRATGLNREDVASVIDAIEKRDAERDDISWESVLLGNVQYMLEEGIVGRSSEAELKIRLYRQAYNSNLVPDTVFDDVSTKTGIPRETSEKICREIGYIPWSEEEERRRKEDQEAFEWLNEKAQKGLGGWTHQDSDKNDEN